jgi:hypothetical protein
MRGRRLAMNLRRIVGITVLVLAAAAVTLSCSFDYWMDFRIGDIAVGTNYVDVGYSLYNAGSLSMDNAQIHIEVTADLALGGSETLEQWTPGVNLSVFEQFSGTLFFTFSGDIVGPVVVEVIGTRWDEHSSSY